MTNAKSTWKYPSGGSIKGKVRLRLHRDGSVDVWHTRFGHWVPGKAEIAEKLCRKFNLVSPTKYNNDAEEKSSSKPPPLSLAELEKSAHKGVQVGKPKTVFSANKTPADEAIAALAALQEKAEQQWKLAKKCLDSLSDSSTDKTVVEGTSGHRFVKVIPSLTAQLVESGNTKPGHAREFQSNVSRTAPMMPLDVQREQNNVTNMQQLERNSIETQNEYSKNSSGHKQLSPQSFTQQQPGLQTPLQYQQSQVTHQYQQSQVPHQYHQSQVPLQYQQSQVTHQYQQSQVTHQYQQSQTPHQYQQRQTPHQYQQSQTPHQYRRNHLQQQPSRVQARNIHETPLLNQFKAGEEQEHGDYSQPRPAHRSPRCDHPTNQSEETKYSHNQNSRDESILNQSPKIATPRRDTEFVEHGSLQQDNFNSPSKNYNQVHIPSERFDLGIGYHREDFLEVPRSQQPILAECFGQWKNTVSIRERRKNAVTKVLDTLSSRILKDALSRWAAAVRIRKHVGHRRNSLNSIKKLHRKYTFRPKHRQAHRSNKLHASKRVTMPTQSELALEVETESSENRIDRVRLKRSRKDTVSSTKQRATSNSRIATQKTHKLDPKPRKSTPNVLIHSPMVSNSADTFFNDPTADQNSLRHRRNITDERSSSQSAKVFGNESDTVHETRNIVVKEASAPRGIDFDTESDTVHSTRNIVVKEASAPPAIDFGNESDTVHETRNISVKEASAPPGIDFGTESSKLTSERSSGVAQRISQDCASAHYSKVLSRKCFKRWRITSKLKANQSKLDLYQRSIALRASFATWEKYLKYTKAFKSFVTLVLRRFQEMKLRFTLNRWKQYTTTRARLEQVAIEADNLQREEQVRILFMRLKEKTQQSRRLQLFKSIVLRTLLRGCFRSWFATTQDIVATKLADLHYKHLKQLVTLKEWRAFVTRKHRTRTLFNNLVARVKRSLESSALRKWKLASQQEMFLVQLKVFHHDKTRRMRTSVRNWKSYVEKRSQKRRAVNMAISARRKQLLQKGIKVWTEWCSNKQFMRRCIEVVMIRKDRNIVKRVLHQWHQVSQSRARHQWIASQTIMQKHFDAWNETAQLWKVERLNLSKAIQYQESKVLHSTLGMWMDWKATKQSLKLREERGRTMMMHYRARKCMKWILTWSKHQHVCRSYNMLAISRWRTRSLSRVFVAWKTYSRDAHISSRVELFQHEAQYRLKMQYMARWMQFLYIGRKTRAVQPLVDQRWRRTVLRQGIQALQHYVEQQQHERLRLAMASHHWVLASLDTSMSHWRHWLETQRCRHEARRLAISWWRKRLLLKLFGAWLQVTVQSSLVAQLLWKRNQKLKYRVFVLWRFSLSVCVM